jgi:hypothetical protein
VLTSITGLGGANNTTRNPTVLSQYCNGSRVPPEFKSLGYQVPPGIADATVPNPIFNLTPAATVDEGNNWINISWGPLARTNPVTSTQLGNYGPASSSSVINYIPNSAVVAYMLAPSTDFYGNARKTNNAVDAGAVEFVAPPNTAIASVTGGPLRFGNVVDGTTSAAQTLTLHNTGTANLTGISVNFSSPRYSRPGGAAGGTCAGTLTPAVGTCTINVVFSPTQPGEVDATVTINANVGVTGSPVLLTGAGVAPTLTASVSPSPLAFGNWATGTTSDVRNLTVTNTGNAQLNGGSVSPLSAPFSRVNNGTFPSGAPNCAGSLAVGASCTIKVQFAPTTTGNLTQNVTVSYTNATVTPTPVVLTGTGVASRATASITPNPLTITLPTGVNTGTGTVTLTNAAPAAGAQMTVSGVTVSSALGGSPATWFFNAVAGADTCTGTTLAPGATCTVGVRFTNVLSPRGTNRNGTITFTDNAQTSPQSGGLIGFATAAVAAIGGAMAP